MAQMALALASSLHGVRSRSPRDPPYLYQEESMKDPRLARFVERKVLLIQLECASDVALSLDLEAAGAW